MAIKRSLKYEKLTDNEIVELAMEPMSGDKKYYLNLEVELRGLQERISEGKRGKLKEAKRNKSLGLRIFGIFMIVMFMFRFGPKLVSQVLSIFGF